MTSVDIADSNDMTDDQLLDVMAATGAVEVLPSRADVNMGRAALWYATKLGWPCFPLRPRGKQPVGGNGFKDATTDVATIERWWTSTPDANIGIPTGPVALGGIGFDVLDVDGPRGQATLETMRHELCPSGCGEQVYCPALGTLDTITYRAFTPGNGTDRKPGRHLYLPATGEGCHIGFEPGVDYKGAGGYVVAPPSVALHGVRYAWVTWPVAA